MPSSRWSFDLEARNDGPVDDLPLPRQAAQVDEHHDRRARPRSRAGRRRASGPSVDTEPTSTGFGMTIEAMTPDKARELEAAGRQGRRRRQQRQPQQPGEQRRRCGRGRHPRGQPHAGDQRGPGQARARECGRWLDRFPRRLARRPRRRAGDVPDAEEKIDSRHRQSQSTITVGNPSRQSSRQQSR